MQVLKRNGELEAFDLDKIHKTVEWAIGDLKGVSLSDIEMNANLSIVDGISTKEIHKVLIKSASDLITITEPNYQTVAARLLCMQLRKDVWGHANTPPSLLHHIQINVDNGIYDPEILEKWDKEDIQKAGSWLDHKRDDLYTYAGLQQMIDKYLVKNRITGEVYETPQYAYMCLALCLFNELKQVKKAYDCFSSFKLNLPTPIMAGVRTNIRQFASCVLVDIDDDLNSIFASTHAVGKYTARRAGIGLNFGRIRPINSPIRGGEVVHTGVIPYLKVLESTCKSTTQNGLRGGSATANFPFWHYEIDDVLVLKNNAGTDDNRVRKLDYVIQFSHLFYDRLIKGQDITLFSPAEAPGLYEAFGNNEEFDKLYKKYEKDNSINMKRVIPARKLAEIFAKERLETGRIYSMNIDNCNEQGSWNIPVKMTNLCCEILHPTKPIKDVNSDDGEIGICMLAAINTLEATTDSQIQSACEMAVNTIENVIDYQDYPVQAGEVFTKKRRSLGIGITNLAGFLAKHKVSYNDPAALKLVHELMEKIQWHLLDASCKLAQKFGRCEGFKDTKYAQGLLPIDWYKKSVDELVEPNYVMDWEDLRTRIAEHGLRHSTLTAIMPCESSSVIQNSTNGVEPPRNLLSYKKSKAGVLKQLVPNVASRKNMYTQAWDLQDNKGIIHINAVLQKFVDMGISTNLYYNYDHFPDGNVPLSNLIMDQIYGYKYGIKTFYYANTPDGTGKTEQEEEDVSGCESGSCSI